MSIAMLVFAGVAVAGATGAFFSDTETSTGNTFTAGAIDLTVDSVAHYNDMVCAYDSGVFVWTPDEHILPYTPGTDPYPSAGSYDQGAWNAANPAQYPQAGDRCYSTWEATDLGAQMFFYLTDVKPGDEGENTISLHVDNNDAWGCVDLDITKNDDVTCTEPEDAADAENGDCNNSVPSEFMDGELADNLEFFAWLDDGDNEYEDNEYPLFSNVSGPASDVLGGRTYTLASPNEQPVPLTGAQTTYIGLAWCAGDMSVVGTTISCDGSTMENDTQTDSLEATIGFRVEQSRNNDLFSCDRQIPPTGGNDQ